MATEIISPARFAYALQSLRNEGVIAKAAELQNSISHLLSSNIQMEPFAREGDEVCRDAIAENQGVIARQEELIRLCRAEIERRGQPWSAHMDSIGKENETQGSANGGLANGHATENERGPRLTDEELRRELEARMGAEEEEGGDDDGGVHL